MELYFLDCPHCGERNNTYLYCYKWNRAFAGAFWSDWIDNRFFNCYYCSLKFDILHSFQLKVDPNQNYFDPAAWTIPKDQFLCDWDHNRLFYIIDCPFCKTEIDTYLAWKRSFVETETKFIKHTFVTCHNCENNIDYTSSYDKDELDSLTSEEFKNLRLQSAINIGGIL